MFPAVQEKETKCALLICPKAYDPVLERLLLTETATRRETQALGLVSVEREEERKMEKILILGCKRAMDNVCIACSRCLVGFNRREGEFNRYKDKEAELVGLLNCGDCPGATVVTRLAQMNLWNKPMGEKVTAIHLGPCLTDHCPHRETIVKKVQDKSGVPVILGTHPYKPDNIFAQG